GQSNLANQNANDNTSNATSGPVNINGPGGDVEVNDSQLKSLADADPEVTQGAEQSNVLAQDQEANDASTQNKSASSQNNNATQNANSNTSTATSQTVSINGSGDVTVADSKLESRADADSEITQGALQSNFLDQHQGAGANSSQTEFSSGQHNTANQ